MTFGKTVILHQTAEEFCGTLVGNSVLKLQLCHVRRIVQSATEGRIISVCLLERGGGLMGIPSPKDLEQVGP